MDQSESYCTASAAVLDAALGPARNEDGHRTRPLLVRTSISAVARSVLGFRLIDTIYGVHTNQSDTGTAETKNRYTVFLYMGH